jgi:hypothetical protein
MIEPENEVRMKNPFHAIDDAATAAATCIDEATYARAT